MALLQFHIHHFPNQKPPELLQFDNRDQEEEDILGYYVDGVKRTLTDEQIALFRHTEIQKLKRDRECKIKDSRRSKQKDVNAKAISELNRSGTQAVPFQRRSPTKSPGKKSNSDISEKVDIVLHYDEVGDKVQSTSAAIYHWPKLG